MEFCEKCGSYMRMTKNGFVCRKCGNLVHFNAERKATDVEKREPPRSIHVIDRSESGYVKVAHVCPECGHGEAFRWFSRVAGEHAGIRSERTVAHFKCTKCSHSWSEIA